jgi:hypothetical protein
MIIERRDVLFLIDKDKNEFYYNITYELDENLNIHFLRVKINNSVNDHLVQYYNPTTNEFWQDADDAFNYILSGIQFIDLSLQIDELNNNIDGNI